MISAAAGWGGFRWRDRRRRPDAAGREELDSEMERKKIAEIKSQLQQTGEDELGSFIHTYEKDERAGVLQLVGQARQRITRLAAERERTKRLMKYEEEYAAYGLICGIDEAGRGPLAGPVVAGAVILPQDCEILHINDSKKLSAARREELYEVILEKAVAVGVGMVGPQRIDEINILQATYEAMREAISKLNEKPDILLNDAVTIPGIGIRQVPIIKGDEKSISIGAASIVAKVTRDRLMAEYDRLMPEYGFASCKGYGTKEHIAALNQYGPSPIHRISFIRKFIQCGKCRNGEDYADNREAGAVQP